ncbi:MAG: glycosyltransferase family 2 protein [Blastocatellia bacterium]
MPTLTAALIHQGSASSSLVEALVTSPVVSELIFLGPEPALPSAIAKGKTRVVEGDCFSAVGIAHLLDAVKTDYLLLMLPGNEIEPGPRAFERLLQAAGDTGASLAYSDFRDKIGSEISDHPLLDYQPGSLRDSFDFGAMIIVSKQAADGALREYGRTDEAFKYAGWYDLRLKLSTQALPMRIPEPLYTRVPADRRASGERQFDYVDPRQREYQVETEQVATAHLKRAGAHLGPGFRALPPGERFSVRASVVIPVRNRERTIKDALTSALSQRASFEFNVIVVDNHSTDRTTEILEHIASHDKRLNHLRPERTDLGIGGCWNEAIFSSHCGEYAVQLDSDDLYSDDQTLGRIVAKFEEGPYAMVIGAYTIVNFELQEIPPGLIDHREWTRENGRNNALRINGLGAPRAFYVPVLRQIGFPNVSYGEDYSVALKISREYEIGRIYEPLYFARRWEGNSDAALPLAISNRYDAYKDHLRTIEILARKRLNQR